MARRLKQWSAVLFLFTTLTTADSVTLKAANCTSFMNDCSVSTSWPYFQFDCGPGITCEEIGFCLAEACSGGGGICNPTCEPSGGPCGWGVCQ